ncbi:MAG: ORF6N domain-containing protein [Pirellulales bacterium]
MYGVETRALMQAVKRNHRRFPIDFTFRLTLAEAEALRSQIVISKKGRGGRRGHCPTPLPSRAWLCCPVY